jgi:hypothetical protein
MNPPPIFQSGGFVVVTYVNNEQKDISKPFATREEAQMYVNSLPLNKPATTMRMAQKAVLKSYTILPLTRLLKNPPLSSHGSSIRTKRTHGLSLAEMRALYKLVQRGNDMAVAYARKKLEVPRSASKSDLLAVVDHHIRDLADR